MGYIVLECLHHLLRQMVDMLWIIIHLFKSEFTGPTKSNYQLLWLLKDNKHEVLEYRCVVLSPTLLHWSVGESLHVAFSWCTEPQHPLDHIVYEQWWMLNLVPIPQRQRGSFQLPKRYRSVGMHHVSCIFWRWP